MTAIRSSVGSAHAVHEGEALWSVKYFVWYNTQRSSFGVIMQQLESEGEGQMRGSRGGREIAYLISGKSQRPVLDSLKGLRNMLLMVGLISVASRRTTYSNPSLLIRVMYLPSSE